MEGEPLWYKLRAMAFTFGIYFPPPHVLVPRKFLVAPTIVE